MKKVLGIIIDPQNDFCLKNGSLFVPGADIAMNRVATMIRADMNRWTELWVSMDSHQTIHIAHPIFWVNEKGEHPPVFSCITLDDFEKNVWKPSYTDVRLNKWIPRLLKGLANKSENLQIWPPHCRLLTPGQNVVANLADTLIKWEEKTFNKVVVIQKGNNFLTEQFSMIQAAVPYPDDPTTDVNWDLLDQMNEFDEIVWSGIALSHCLGASMKDCIELSGQEIAKKFVLLTDGTESVGTPEGQAKGKSIVEKLVRYGVRLSTTIDY